MFSVFATTSSRIPNIIFFMYMIFFFFFYVSFIFTIIPILTFISILIRVTFSTIKDKFTSACFANIFDSFIPVIVLRVFRFKIKSSVLFGTHTLLDRSLRALELLTHLSKLTANGSSRNP